jgi:hypothetical protein
MPYDDDDYDPDICDCDDCRRSRGDDDDDYGYGPGPDATRERPPSIRPSGLRPLANILRTPGTLWSAEIEVVGIGYSRAARELGCESGGYGENGGRGQILATSDATVDAEIKLSQMLDGDAGDAAMAAGAYVDLREAGAVADYSCGHHVHVDASAIAQAGQAVAIEVVRAAAALGAVCDRTLTVLASTGYGGHREDSGNTYGGSWHIGPYILGDRYKLHGARTGYALNYGNPSYATVEYRLPNGTLYAHRAHAHLAIAMGLVDLAKAAWLDADPNAQEAVRNAMARLDGWTGPDYLRSLDPPGFSEADGAAFLSRYLRLHADSYSALALAAADAPASAQHKAVWEIAAATRKGL